MLPFLYGRRQLNMFLSLALPWIDLSQINKFKARMEIKEENKEREREKNPNNS